MNSKMQRWCVEPGFTNATLSDAAQNPLDGKVGLQEAHFLTGTPESIVRPVRASFIFFALTFVPRPCTMPLSLKRATMSRLMPLSRMFSISLEESSTTGLRETHTPSCFVLP